MKSVQRGMGPWPVNNQLHTVQEWMMLRLGGNSENREMRSVSRMFLDAVSGLDRGQRIMKDWKANESALDLLALWCDRFKNGEPVQYILEQVEFFGLSLKIDSRALIPRPETEELIRDLIKRQENAGCMRVLDIGTGSGCMALAWKALRPNDDVTGVDVSESSLSLAIENAVKLGFQDVNWRNVNVLDEAPFEGVDWGVKGWDVIMSNPPYIPISEKATMENRVVHYEPSNALFVADQDPLCFYRVISSGCVNEGWLAAGGWLGMECHRDYSGDVVAFLSNQAGWESIDLLNDLQGQPRMVIAKKL